MRQKQARQQRLKEICAKVEAECIPADADARLRERRSTNFAVRARSRRSCATRSSTASRASTAATRAPCARSRIRTGVLPRTHGSALFTRGETQALVVATLGTARDEQIIDALHGRVPRPLHAPLQHAAVRHRRDRPRRLAQAPRDRPRPPRQARAARGAADRARSSPTRCASSPRSPSRTAARRWRRCAAAASR